MIEYERQIVDLVDLIRRIKDEKENAKGKSQFIKGLRKAQLIALELSYSQNRERTGYIFKNDKGWTCSGCNKNISELTPYCPQCGIKFTNYESEKLKYGDYS